MWHLCTQSDMVFSVIVCTFTCTCKYIMLTGNLSVKHEAKDDYVSQ